MNNNIARYLLLAGAVLGAAGCSHIGAKAIYKPFYIGTWDDINAASVTYSTSGTNTNPTLMVHMRGYLDGTYTTPSPAPFNQSNYPDTYKLQNVVRANATPLGLWALLTTQNSLTQPIEPSTFYQSIAQLASDQASFASGPISQNWEVDVSCDTYTVQNQPESHQAYVDLIFRQSLTLASREDLAALIERAQSGGSSITVDETKFADVKDPGVRSILGLSPLQAPTQ